MIKIKNLRGSVLYTAETAQDVRAALEEAVLRGTNLDGANLDGANLRGANLHGANLRGANLHGANLRGANLDGANLRGANLDGANLRGTNLPGANLDGANLRGAIWAQVADKLRIAIAAMNDGGRHWIKGSFEKKLEDGSAAYCSIGAIQKCADEGTVRALALWLVENVCAGSIASFNDAPNTTWEDVQAVFAVAIKHAERFAEKGA